MRAADIEHRTTKSDINLGEPRQSSRPGKCAAARPNPQVGRRTFFLSAASVAALSATGLKPASASSKISITLTGAKYGGVGDGVTDNAPAFTAAFNAIANAGGGSLTIPSGNYVLNSAVAYTGPGQISIFGDGQDVTTILVNPNLTGTAITIQPSGNLSAVTIRDLSFMPNSGSAITNCTALAITMPANGVGVFNHLVLEDCDFNQGNGYGFTTSLALSNVNESRITNLFGHGVLGTTFMTLASCIDLRIDNLNISNQSTGIRLLDANCQGIHITNSVIISGTTCLTTQLTNNAPINLLELYISGCEFTATGNTLNLYSVNTSFISDSHFGAGNNGVVGIPVYLNYCARLHFSECQIDNAFNETNGPAYGIYVDNGTNNSLFDNLRFENVSTGIYLASGVTSNTGKGLRQFAYGDGMLIGAPIVQGNVTGYVVQDNSGTAYPNQNFFEWLGPNDTTLYSTKRNYYSQP